jgi:hypothetical protein
MIKAKYLSLDNQYGGDMSTGFYRKGATIEVFEGQERL